MISRNLATSAKFFAVFILLTVISTVIQAAQRDYYALKVYHLKDEQQLECVENYLKQAYLPAMHRAGISKVGVFKPIEETSETGLQLFVWFPVKSIDQFVGLPEQLGKDGAFQQAGANYIDASFDNVPYVRIETILLKAFEKMPQFAAPNYPTSASERVYELRSYEGPTEKLYERKVEMFNDGGEIALFKKLDFNAVFYAEVISGSSMPNLMYMTTFQNMKAHDEHWDAFRNHPDWKTLSGMDKYKNTVSKATKYLLKPTDYSDI